MEVEAEMKLAEAGFLGLIKTSWTTSAINYYSLRLIYEQKPSYDSLVGDPGRERIVLGGLLRSVRAGRHAVARFTTQYR